MKRRTEFLKSVMKPAQIKDSRFGIRKIYLNTQDKPSVFSYANPGRNWHGTK